MSTDYAQKIQAGTTFPEMEVQVLNGEMTSLGKPENGHDWNWLLSTVVSTAQFAQNI